MLKIKEISAIHVKTRLSARLSTTLLNTSFPDNRIGNKILSMMRGRPLLIFRGQRSLLARCEHHRVYLFLTWYTYWLMRKWSLFIYKVNDQKLFVIYKIQKLYFQALSNNNAVSYCIKSNNFNHGLCWKIVYFFLTLLPLAQQSSGAHWSVSQDLQSFDFPIFA